MVRVVYGIGRVDKRRCSRRADRLIVLLYLCEIRRRMRGRTVRGSASGGCWAVWVFSTDTLSLGVMLAIRCDTRVKIEALIMAA